MVNNMASSSRQLKLDPLTTTQFGELRLLRARSHLSTGLGS